MTLHRPAADNPIRKQPSVSPRWSRTATLRNQRAERPRQMELRSRNDRDGNCDSSLNDGLDRANNTRRLLKLRQTATRLTLVAAVSATIQAEFFIVKASFGRTTCASVRPLGLHLSRAKKTFGEERHIYRLLRLSLFGRNYQVYPWLLNYFEVWHTYLVLFSSQLEIGRYYLYDSMLSLSVNFQFLSCVKVEEAPLRILSDFLNHVRIYWSKRPLKYSEFVFSCCCYFQS